MNLSLPEGNAYFKVKTVSYSVEHYVALPSSRVDLSAYSKYE
jgi:hypothetical protein